MIEYRSIGVRRTTARCLFVLSALGVVVHSAPTALAAEYVIHISVDGLNPHWLQEVIDAGKAPTFKRLEEEGAWTVDARTDYTHTVTIPNHTCMLTGRPVEQPTGMPNTTHHGYDYNDVPTHGSTLHNSGSPHVDYVASTFDVAHDAGLTTGLFVSKDKFIIYDQSYNESTGAANEHGRDKIDVYFFQDDGPPTYSAGMNERFLSEMRAHPFNYVFVHYRDTDSAGHAEGWGSGAYRQAIMVIDGYLSDVLHLVETNPKLKGRTAIVITADHGGIGLNHYEQDQPENYTIPVIVWGAGVGHGDLYAMNADSRRDPGKERPDYAAPDQPIRNGGTGNLALSLLGLGPIPGSLINAEQDLQVVLTGDYNGDGAVDSADYTVWRDTLGSTTDLRADGDRNGKVEEADFKLWRSRYGSGMTDNIAPAAP